jgi:pimeloyl-ACP methyl ester carboxylesterase
MKRESNVLWLSVSPALRCLDQRLLSQLVKGADIQRWEYFQSLDEPCSLDAVVETLHEYLQARSHTHAGKPHLLGHGVSGVVALMYARRYPQQVASLTLLSVNARPAVNWQAHYYALRQRLPCSRDIILAQMSRLLFGEQPLRFLKAFATLLARDLDENLTLHSLAHHTTLAPGGTGVPMLLCYGEADAVRSRGGKGGENTGWESYLKPGDRIWQFPEGNHFFHFYDAIAVSGVILDYWQQLAKTRAFSSPIVFTPKAIEQSVPH